MIIFKGNIPKKYFFMAGTAILVGMLVLGFGGGKKAETIKVVQANVVQEVSVTGKTKARNEVELGFNISGRVARSFVHVGDFAARGRLLAELDISSELATLSKERATLLEAEADYNEQGKNIALAVMEGYSTSDNAVRNKADQFFKTPRDNPQFEVKFNDGNFTHYFNVPSELVLELNQTRKSLEGLLTVWQAELVQMDFKNSNQFSNLAIERMNTVSNFLNKVAYSINSFAPNEFAYESTVVGYKTAIDSARSTVATAKEKISSISSQEAKVSQIKSSIRSLEAELSKSKIIAPFSGTVTKQEAKQGQIAKAGEPLITMISESDMYIEANVSEINIAKISLGNKAKIEFDALPGEIFEGAVVFIDPAETIVDGVANYKVRVEILAMDPRIKSGLTTNINIETERREGVLAIPVYAVVKEGDKSFVQKLEGGQVIRVEVTTGLLGRDGNIEIISGLNEGDELSY